MASSASAALENAELADHQPLVKPRALPSLKPRSHEVLASREVTAISPVAIIGFIAACIMVGLCLVSRIQLDKVNLQQDALQTELSDLQSQYRDLSSEYEQLFDMDSIRSQMEASGSMFQPSSSQVIYMDLSRPDSSETWKESDSNTHSLGALVNNVLDAFR